MGKCAVDTELIPGVQEGRSVGLRGGVCGADPFDAQIR